MLVNPYIYGGSNNLVTTLYTGTGSARSIVTGQSLAAGALVWIKSRSHTSAHELYDTVRGATKWIESNNNESQKTDALALSAFNSNGFSIGGGDSSVNLLGGDFVAWSFLKKAGFLDIVEWTGNGTSQAINHALDSTVGMIIVKEYSHADDWQVYHRQLNGGTNPEQYRIELNLTGAEDFNSGMWNNTAPTTTQFTVGSSANANESGRSYIAYVFAHNPAQKIFCGSFTTDGSGNATVTGLGFRPKWLMVKNTVSTAGGVVENWIILDIERNWSSSAANLLYANKSDAEIATGTWGEPTSGGFTISNLRNSNAHIYMAVG